MNHPKDPACSCMLTAISCFICPLSPAPPAPRPLLGSLFSGARLSVPAADLPLFPIHRLNSDSLIYHRRCRLSIRRQTTPAREHSLSSIRFFLPASAVGGRGPGSGVSGCCGRGPMSRICLPEDIGSREMKRSFRHYDGSKIFDKFGYRRGPMVQDLGRLRPLQGYGRSPPA